MVGVGGNQSRDSTSVLDSPTSCTGIFDQLWFCLCKCVNGNRAGVIGCCFEAWRGVVSANAHQLMHTVHIHMRHAAPVYQAREYYVTGAYVSRESRRVCV